MNAEYRKKRDLMAHKMWACLAAWELCLALLVPALHLWRGQVTTVQALCLLVLAVAATGAGIAALVCYVFACEYYAKAKGADNDVNRAGIAGLISMISLPVLLAAGIVFLSGSRHGLDLFLIPLLQLLPLFSFALGALTIRLLPDRCREPAP